MSSSDPPFVPVPPPPAPAPPPALRGALTAGEWVGLAAVNAGGGLLGRVSIRAAEAALCVGRLAGLACFSAVLGAVAVVVAAVLTAAATTAAAVAVVTALLVAAAISGEEGAVLASWNITSAAETESFRRTLCEGDGSDSPLFAPPVSALLAC